GWGRARSWQVSEGIFQSAGGQGEQFGGGLQIPVGRDGGDGSQGGRQQRQAGGGGPASAGHNAHGAGGEAVAGGAGAGVAAAGNGADPGVLAQLSEDCGDAAGGSPVAADVDEERRRLRRGSKLVALPVVGLQGLAGGGVQRHLAGLVELAGPDGHHAG